MNARHVNPQNNSGKKKSTEKQKIYAIGLQSQVWNNNLRSIMLIGTYPFVILGIVWLLSYAMVGLGGTPHVMPQMASSGQVASNYATNIILEYWPTILAVVAAWFGISYFFQTKMIRSMAHSHPVTRKEEPELYNLVENLCIAEGMKMPRLEIIEQSALNAFASGVDDNTYCVTVTRGLMQSLQKDEIEGVLAHELSHIKHRDVRLLIISIIFVSMIGFISQLIWNNMRYSMLFSNRSNNRNGSPIVIMLAMGVIAGVAYLISLLTRFSLSRRREYMADAGAVIMTKNPEAMMRALQRISGQDKILGASPDVQMMCIENSVPFMGFFATHPPINKRIEAISQMTSTSVPTPSALDASRMISAKRNTATAEPAATSRNAKSIWGNRPRANPWDQNQS
jgi:heat shock protein HtpX